MDLFEGGSEVHPAGEVEAEDALTVDTHGRRIHMEWDPASPVTPLDLLIFFSQFLATGGLFSHWIGRCPLRFSSPNAPTLTNLLGTITPSVLAGQFRYAHITVLRADTVIPVGLEMSKVCSEDSEDSEPLPEPTPNRVRTGSSRLCGRPGCWTWM